MLSTIKQTITLEGSSQIDTTIAETYRATINSEDPEDMNIASWQRNKDVYKNNRDTCHQDRADFEDYVYGIQDEMIKSKATTSDDN